VTTDPRVDSVSGAGHEPSPMPPATTGRYRVVDREGDRVLLADREDEYDPVAATVGSALDADLDPGNVVEAEVAFGAETAELVAATVVRPTVFEYVPDADVVFEAARETWRRAQAAGDGMGSRVTRDTDGAVNGVVYVFADTPSGDRIEEFRSGRRPLDPLLERVADSEGEGAREVFVVSPDERFVIVTIAEPDGLFARTMRETYGLPGAGDLDLSEHADSGGAVPDLPDGLGDVTDDAVEGVPHVDSASGADSMPGGDGVPSAESLDDERSGSDDGVETDDLGGVSALGHDGGEDGDAGEDENGADDDGDGTA